MSFGYKRNKFKVAPKAFRTIDDIVFDSKKEMTRYLQLKSLQKAKKIKDLELQPRYELQPPFNKNGKKYPAITYVADFKYFDLEKNILVIEDSKGMMTPVFKIKQKMFEYVFSDLHLEVT